MSPDIHLLLSIQALDETLAGLSTEIEQIPKHIAETEKRLRSQISQLTADKEALSANHKKNRDLEHEIGIHAAKISKLKGQLLDAKTNEQYRALQNEIEFNENAIRNAEDEQLALMEQAEQLSANVQAADTALKAEEASVKADQAAARKRLAELQAAKSKDLDERQTLLTQLSKDVLRSYESMKHRGRRRVVAEVDGTSCGACHVTVRLQVVQELTTGDELHRCENCAAYLYIIRPTAIDTHGPSA